MCQQIRVLWPYQLLKATWNGADITVAGSKVLTTGCMSADTLHSQDITSHVNCKVTFHPDKHYLILPTSTVLEELFENKYWALIPGRHGYTIKVVILRSFILHKVPFVGSCSTGTTGTWNPIANWPFPELVTAHSHGFRLGLCLYFWKGISHPLQKILYLQIWLLLVFPGLPLVAMFAIFGSFVLL